VTTILAGLTWHGERTQLRQYVRIRDGEEGLIKVLFDAAVQVAHDFIGRRDFTEPAMPTTEWVDGMGLTDADPAEVLASAAIPAQIRLGVYEYVRVAYALRARSPGAVSEGNAGGNIGIDLWAARNQGDLPLAVARGYWYPYLLDGSVGGGVPKL
jgi:hypothetical protein